MVSQGPTPYPSIHSPIGSFISSIYNYTIIPFRGGIFLKYQIFHPKIWFINSSTFNDISHHFSLLSFSSFQNNPKDLYLLNKKWQISNALIWSSETEFSRLLFLFFLELYTYIMNGEIYFSFVGKYEHREAEILEHHVVSKWVPLDIFTTCMFSPLVHTWKTDHGIVLVYTFCSYKTGIFPSRISPKIF